MNEFPKYTESPVSEPNNSVAWFSFLQQVQFTLKELRETLRDRRTIVTLLAMPILLYPLLGLGFRFVAVQQSLEQKREYHLALANEAEAQWLVQMLQSADTLVEPAPGGVPEPQVQILTPNDGTDFDLKVLVSESVADLGIRIKFDDFGGAINQGARPARVTILQNQGSSLSRDAADFVETRLSAVNIEIIKEWARRNQASLTVPITQSRELVEPPEESSPILGLLPLVLLLMTVTGGVYPAIDLTAGERERNTLESLMALPVPRFRLLFAKYVAVISVTLLTGLMNLIAMGTTLYALQLDKVLLGGESFTFGLAFKLFIVLSAFGLFYSAVLLLLTSFARSFKEAQAYLIPLLLLSIAPGLVILMPDWNLTNATAAIPLVNMLLLARELLEGTLQTLPAVAAVISTVLYGIAALAIAAQVFGNDAVAVGSRGRWTDLFQRPHDELNQPTMTSALVSLAVLFPAYFIVSGVLARSEEAGLQNRLWISGFLTVALFLGLPCLFLRWQKIPVPLGLSIKPVKIITLAASILMGLATWPWIFELVVLAKSIGLHGVDLSQISEIDQLLAGWKAVPLWLILVVLGVLPGICEECFFRGYLFNGLRQHLNAQWTIVVTAIAFGLFHVVLAGGAAPERLLPSTLMGLLLGWVVWKSQSIVPAIMLHVIHNCTLLVIVNSRDLLTQWNLGHVEQEHLPWVWLVSCGILFLIGVALFHYSQRRKFFQKENSV